MSQDIVFVFGHFLTKWTVGINKKLIVLHIFKQKISFWLSFVDDFHEALIYGFFNPRQGFYAESSPRRIHASTNFSASSSVAKP